MAIQERDPRAYELMTVFIPELSEEDNQVQIEKVSTYISNAGGTVKETLTSSPWGRRRLAYTIRFNNVDYRDGFYTVYHFDSAPSFLTELERDLKLDTSTMRYLLVHDDPKAGEKFPQGDGEEAADENAAPAETTTAPAAQSATEPAAATATESTAQEASAEEAESAAEAATESETPAESAGEPAETAAEGDSEAAIDTASTDSEETPSDDETTENNDESSEKE